MEYLTVNVLGKYIKDVLAKVKVFLPGGSSEEQKEWVTQELIVLLEVFDNQVPVIGAFMDLPNVDQLEANAVEQLVNYVWEHLELYSDVRE
jgi:hypothetical protein